MAPIPFPVAVTAIVQLGDADKILRAYAARAKDLQPFFLGVLDPHVSKLIEEQFATRGKVFGTKPWAALSPATIAMRSRSKSGAATSGSLTKRGRARAGVDTPLQDTRRLWSAYVKSQGPEAIRRVTPSTYERGVTVPYAQFHQLPYPSVVYGRRTGRNVPARPVLPRNAKDIPAAVAKQWSELLEAYLRAAA